MTLCIAAVCDGAIYSSLPPKIVLCSDMERAFEGVGASETEYKVGFVRAGWPALQAGRISRSNDLARQYAAYLDKHFSEIDEHNVLDHLRRPAETQKSKLVDHYLKQAHSFGRD